MIFSFLGELIYEHPFRRNPIHTGTKGKGCTDFGYCNFPLQDQGEGGNETSPSILKESEFRQEENHASTADAFSHQHPEGPRSR